MKNKRKAMMLLGIILTFILLSTVIYITLFSTEKHICTIKSINEDDIVAELLETLDNKNSNDTDSLTKKQYTFSISNILIKDEKGKKISKTDLKVGDIICIIKKKEKTKVDLAYSIEPLHNIKSIKLIQYNSN